MGERKREREERFVEERKNQRERKKRKERIIKQDKFPSQLISNQTMARINWLLEAKQSVRIKCYQSLESKLSR